MSCHRNILWSFSLKEFILMGRMFSALTLSAVKKDKTESSWSVEGIVINQLKLQADQLDTSADANLFSTADSAR